MILLLKNYSHIFLVFKSLYISLSRSKKWSKRKKNNSKCENREICSNDYLFFLSLHSEIKKKMKINLRVFVNFLGFLSNDSHFNQLESENFVEIVAFMCEATFIFQMISLWVLKSKKLFRFIEKIVTACFRECPYMVNGPSEISTKDK